mmetsp:Transcript_24246/g.38823  ORF Transcript_24246/g.38823 Transcript_24246/m.38823 type:complete len:217 (+) Transcript_24246:78-728(+)
MPAPSAGKAPYGTLHRVHSASAFGLLPSTMTMPLSLAAFAMLPLLAICSAIPPSSSAAAPLLVFLRLLRRPSWCLLENRDPWRGRRLSPLALWSSWVAGRRCLSRIPLRRSTARRRSSWAPVACWWPLTPWRRTRPRRTRCRIHCSWVDRRQLGNSTTRVLRNSIFFVVRGCSELSLPLPLLDAVADSSMRILHSSFKDFSKLAHLLLISAASHEM